MRYMLGCVVALAGVMWAVAGGCGPDKKDPFAAEYRPVKVPMVVIVEKTATVGLPQEQMDRLASLLGETLVANEVVPVVDPAKLIDLRSRPGYESMSISERAAAVGAAQALYLKLDDYESYPIMSGPAVSRLGGMVSIIEGRTGRRLWPTTGTGERVSATTTQHDPNAMLHDLCEKVGLLLYEKQ